MDRVEVDGDGSVRFDAVTAVHRWDSCAALAQDYWRWSALSGHAREQDDGAAYGCIGAITGDGHRCAVDVIQALVDSAPSVEDLAMIGAGPLEDLMSHSGHGKAFIDEVERRARRQPRFARVVAAVWLGEDVPIDVRTRLGSFGATELSGDRRRRKQR